MNLGDYKKTAIRSAVVTLQWQLPDATGEGDAYPVSESGDEFTDVIVERVPYLSEAVSAVIDAAYENGWLEDVPADLFGHNFILSANGHGAGFWDTPFRYRDELHELAEGYSFEGEFALDDRYRDVDYLTVENEVIVMNGEIQ